MGYNIGPTITVEGERAFNEAMRAMRQNMKYVTAEAGLAMSTFGKNEKSVESLTARNEVLTKALDTQRKGAEKIRGELDKLVAAGLDPASEKYKQLKANLDNVTAAANKTEQEIKENNEAMADLNKKSSGLGDSVKNMADKFGIVLPAGAQKGIEALNSVSASTVAFVGVAVKMISTLVNASTQAAKTADDIMVLSQTTGMSTDKIQELKYSAELIDVSFETLSGSMTKMIRSMNTARNGSKEAAEAYQKLHVRIKEGNGQLRDANTVFYEVIDKLGKVKNETERDAIAMQIFGKSARELNPLIEAGSKGLQAFAEEAHNMGYVIDAESLGKLGALDDAMQRFTGQGEAAKNTLAMALLPALTKFFEVISKIPPSVISTVAVIATVIVTVIALVKAIQSISGVVGAVTKAMDPANAKMMKTTLIILGVVAALIALAVVIAIIMGKSKELNDSMSSMGQSIGNMQNQATGSIPRYASGTLSAKGGLALVGENGPEFVSLRPGARVYNNSESMALLGAGSGGNVFNVTIDAKNVKEFNDIVRIAQRERITARAGTSRR